MLLTKDSSTLNCVHNKLRPITVSSDFLSLLQTIKLGTGQLASQWPVKLSGRKFNCQLVSDVTDVLSDGHIELLIHQVCTDFVDFTSFFSDFVVVYLAPNTCFNPNPAQTFRNCADIRIQ